jgi:hypothetical protein
MVDRALTSRQNTSPGSGRYGQETRILRDRQAAHSDAMDRAAGQQQPYSSARMLVQVYDGGAMPSDPEKVYFTHPVLLTGSETEGAAGMFSVDTATTVPVIVLGHVPSVGDYLTAYAVGGRWVSEEGGSSGGGFTSCSPCNIPNEDLTITWTNVFSGTGSATMMYSPGPQWQIGCVDDDLIFSLSCNAGSIELRATFFLGGSCPTGTSNYCSNLRSNPLSLTLSDHTCSPFSLTFTVTEAGCPSIYGDGNTQLVVTL